MSHGEEALFEPASGLLIRHWNGEAGVVFDASRAMTHLLDIGLLDLLAGGPFPGAELDAQTLHELLRLGLLRRAA